MISDERVRQITEWREKEDEARDKESERKARAIIKGIKVQEMITEKGLVIRPEEVKQCCGNIPSVGARRDHAFVYCCWCKAEVKAPTAVETIEKWNNREKAIVS
jgi:hypothetical protein